MNQNKENKLSYFIQYHYHLHVLNVVIRIYKDHDSFGPIVELLGDDHALLLWYLLNFID